ncbi:helix-turn-helix domain-containing protein [Lactococcus petauri]|uniref:helix-turn-helix domain-containing protein n=1 Tax=Lactococcus petauri TaxID=1940789 RepID=UPI00215A9DD5|nr:helix-turn-helix transcriptional regulator [Lactococcus petauri]MCR8688821.1 helix-turn-helix domain-containing protein [Lactococcus petauri]
MKFSELIQTTRKKKGVTQEELANQLLVSSKTISNWETGKTTPDIDNLIRISSLFQISLDNLLAEGSEVVENIKKKAEINNLKKYSYCTVITDLVFLFIILSSHYGAELPISILIATCIGIGVNIAVMFYFLNRIKILEDKTKKQQRKEIFITIILCILAFVVTMLVSWFKH